MSDLARDAATPMVDVNVPRFNQGVVAAVTALAFVIQYPPLVVMMAVVLLVSAFGPSWAGPLTQLYVRVIRPRTRSGGPTEFEPAAPPRFAQRIGSGVLLGASVAFVVGASAVGWAMTLIVTALAALAATTRICVGCILYERVVSA